MLPTMRAYFHSHENYAYTHTTPAADDVCMICREPFTDELAIQLTDCSHIIGLNCFCDWIRRQPDTCPYWTHALPRLPREASSSENLCNDDWFVDTENQIHELIAMISGTEGQWMNDLKTALDALHADGLKPSNMVTILYTYGLISGFLKLLNFAVMLVCFCTAVLSLWLAYGLIGPYFTGIVLSLIQCLNALFFVAVGLLVLAGVENATFMIIIGRVMLHSLEQARKKKRT